MYYLISSCIAIIFAIVLFFLFGKTFHIITKQKSGFISTVGIGFFLYYGLFQIVALPCVFLKQSLSTLSSIWGCVVLFLLAFFVVYKTKNKQTKSVSCKHVYPEIRSFLQENYIYGIVILLVLWQCYFAMISSYSGWDTAYYVGTINTSLYTDSMYIYNGTTGIMEKELELRYALSSFYMNSAVWCKWLKMEAIPMQCYVINALCQIMTNIYLYLIGKSLWTSKNKIGVFMCANIILNFFFVTTYSSAGFLLERGYEAKAFCANVLVLATIYVVLELHKDIQDITRWRNVFIVISASIPISMSAILLIPVLYVVLMGMLMFKKRNRMIIRYGILCLIPNILYVIIYFLHTQGWLSIKV